MIDFEMEAIWDKRAETDGSFAVAVALAEVAQAIRSHADALTQAIDASNGTTLQHAVYISDALGRLAQAAECMGITAHETVGEVVSNG